MALDSKFILLIGNFLCNVQIVRNHCALYEHPPSKHEYEHPPSKHEWELYNTSSWIDFRHIWFDLWLKSRRSYLKRSLYFTNHRQLLVSVIVYQTCYQGSKIVHVRSYLRVEVR